MEFAATLETAKELKAEVFISSWDLKRAFDSVDRRLLVFSWERLGVPTQLAQYLVDMDKNSKMVVRTPFATVLHQLLGTEGLIEKGATFTPGRGTAQGGVDSTAVYSAFTDILLCALSSVTGGEFYISDVDGNLRGAIPISYVDDLITAQSKAAKLQEMADIVSGFCIMFHLELNTKKFRAYHINWGNHNSPDMAQLVIHTAGWVPVIVPMSMDGSFTHLGVIWDMDLTNSIQYSKVVNKLSHALKVLEKSKASASIKLKILELVIYNQVIYDTKFAMWPLKMYEKLDDIITTSIKIITKNMTSCPTSLIYMDKSDIGLDVKQLSVEIQEAKLAMYYRAIFSKSSRRNFIMSSMIARVLRDSDSQPIQGGSYSTNAELQLRDSWWGTSMIQYLQSLDKSICRNNIHHDKANQLISKDIFVNNSSRQSTLHSLGILTHGELAMDCDDDVIETHKLGIEWAEPYSVCNTPIILRAGQVWAVESKAATKIYELAGFENNLIHYYPWLQKDASRVHITTNDTIFLEQGSSVMMGAGSQHHDTKENMFGGAASTYLLNLQRERYMEDGSNETTVLLKRLRQPSLITVNTDLMPRNNRYDYRSWINHLQPVAFYTAVNTTTTGDICDELLGECSRRNSIVVVAQTKYDDYHALVIESTTNNTTTDLAIIAQAVAATLTNSNTQPILTISKKAVKLSTNIKYKTTANRINPLVTLFNSNRLLVVEKEVINRNKAEVKGMLKATQAAKNKSSEFVINNPNGTVNKAQLIGVLNAIGDTHHGMICNNDGSLFIGDTSDVYKSKKADMYLHARDDYRNSRLIQNGSIQTPERYWQQTSTNIASQIFNLVKDSMKRAMICRIHWDKHCHGRNKAKTNSNTSTGTCELCHQGIEDQQHILWECQHERMKAVREVSICYIEQTLIDTTSNKSTLSTLISEYNNIMMNKDNYSMLLGRIHQHQRKLLKLVLSVEALPETKRIANAQLLIKYHRQTLAPFVIAMYCERQYIIDIMNVKKMKDSLLKTPYWKYTMKYTKDKNPERRLLEARECLRGMEQTNVLHEDGSLVKKNNINNSSSTTHGYKRLKIDSSNSIVLKEAEEDKERRKKGKRKCSTLMEWMISPEGSSDCVLVQHNSEDMIVEDSIQVVQLASDTQEEKKQKVKNANKNKKKTCRQDGIDLWLNPAS